MENDDKPFVCTAPNCGLRFANNDHLHVHQQKHQLSLNIGLRHSDSLIDQTPTPTRFLPKTTEGGGELFEGLPESNPFDQDFKKAAGLSGPVLSNTPIPQIAVIPPEETTTTASVAKATMVVTSSNLEKVKSTIATPLQGIKIIQADPALAKTFGSSGLTVLVGSHNINQNSAAKPNLKRPAGVPISGQNANSISTIIFNPGNQGGTGGMPIIGVKGQAANTSVRSAVPHPAIVTAAGSLQNGNSEFSKSTLAKQKLKEILQNNANAAANNNLARNMMIPSIQQNFNGGSGMSVASNSSSSPNSSVNSPDNLMDDDMMDDEYDLDAKGVPIKRSRRSQDEMDPDERRKRFLERNRAAASRCRQKRKVWVQQLEKKADDLSATNSRLQGDISMLRTEVAQLKALLLAHKDCPVTMQQQKGIIDQTSTVFTQASENHVMSLAPISHHNIETAEEVASSALTDMANQRQLDSRNNRQLSCISVIADGNQTTLNNNVNLN